MRSSINLSYEHSTVYPDRPINGSPRWDRHFVFHLRSLLHTTPGAHSLRSVSFKWNDVLYHAAQTPDANLAGTKARAASGVDSAGEKDYRESHMGFKSSSFSAFTRQLESISIAFFK